ncbi:acyclic terpene utilization AtuA family protein, partial [Mesorhizobium sp. M4A.F.Ca.ET.020.02.1.1]|uniref:acyclic terpene utilization AtuA family protein n=1 Tax=Mesorhizobium sp. M4A.F.Ca.ET.020.02.1.1 TaxID=2496652 RepID=UPI001AECDD51
EEADAVGRSQPSCSVVLGDDVSELMRQQGGLTTLEDGLSLEEILPRMASANAYLGADAVRDALDTGAEIVVTGRVADPSLFLGPMMHHLGWSYDDLDRLAAGTLTGHLLECSGQLTGGCFADPGRKEVEDLAGLGYPFADVSQDGKVTLSKTPKSGGRLDRATCTEQLLYEIHDPSRYITPDCVLDVTGVEFIQRASDRVEVVGAAARPRTRSSSAISTAISGSARWASPGSMPWPAPGLARTWSRPDCKLRGSLTPK